MMDVRVLLNFAVFALLGLSSTPSIGLANGGANCCCNGQSGGWSDNCVCRCCDRCCCCCDRVCQFRLIDGCTKCAWSRTWHAPYQPATPLRQFYVPRPPQCCWYGGFGPGHGYVSGATWETPDGTNCPDRAMLASSDLSADAAMGFASDTAERLGKIPNELDMLGPVGSPAPARGAAPPAR